MFRGRGTIMAVLERRRTDSKKIFQGRMRSHCGRRTLNFSKADEGGQWKLRNWFCNCCPKWVQAKAYLQSERFHLKTFRKSLFFSEFAWVFDHCFFRKVHKWNHYESSNIRLIRRIHKWNPQIKLWWWWRPRVNWIFHIAEPHIQDIWTK